MRPFLLGEDMYCPNNQTGGAPHFMKLSKNDRQRFYKGLRTAENGHWLWCGAKNKNRPHGSFKVKTRYFASHVLAWKIAYRKRTPRNQLLVATCGCRQCCRPEHLEWLAKRQLISNTNRGTRNHNNKLRFEQVLEIRRSSESNTILAKRFRVSRAHVRNIKRGVAWRWVDV